MKKLKKLEKSFAALENKELENLEKVTGGASTAATIKSSVRTALGGTTYDTTNTTDAGVRYTVITSLE